MPAASDALQQRPGATYDELVDLACRLNVWRTLESLLTNSAIVNRMVNDGSLRAVGAFFDAETGAVQILGDHPSMHELCQRRPSGDIVRTATDMPVPAEEALAMLHSGNLRYKAGKSGLRLLSNEDKMLMKQVGCEPTRRMRKGVLLRVSSLTAAHVPLIDPVCCGSWDRKDRTPSPSSSVAPTRVPPSRSSLTCARATYLCCATLATRVLLSKVRR